MDIGEMSQVVRQAKKQIERLQLVARKAAQITALEGPVGCEWCETFRDGCICPVKDRLHRQLRFLLREANEEVKDIQ